MRVIDYKSRVCIESEKSSSVVLDLNITLIYDDDHDDEDDDDGWSQ